MESVEFETKPVPGHEDQVDVVFTIDEQLSGSFNAGVSYGDFNGLSFQAGVQQNNFLGTGNQCRHRPEYFPRLSRALISPIPIPYFTIDGISLGGQPVCTATMMRPNNVRLSTTSSKTQSIGANIGFPVDEYNGLNFGLAYKFENVSRINEYEQIKLFKSLFDDPNNPDSRASSTKTSKRTFGWYRTSLNRGTFPTAGSTQNAALRITVPGSDVQYFKMSYNGSFYFPLTNSATSGYLPEPRSNSVTVTATVISMVSTRYCRSVKTSVPARTKSAAFTSNTVGPKAVYKVPATDQ